MPSTDLLQYLQASLQSYNLEQSRFGSDKLSSFFFVARNLNLLAQAHAAAGHPSKLSLLTFGQHHPAGAGPTAPPPDPADAAARSLSRTLFMEHRAAYGPSLDLWPPPDQDAAPDQARLKDLLADSGEYSLALHHGRVYAERLVLRPEPVPRALQVDPEMTVVVSGGARGLGLEYAKQVRFVSCA